MFAMKLAAWFVQAAYSLCSLFPQQDKIAFLSRQSSRPFDFDLLAPSLDRAFPGYKIVWACVPESGAFGLGLALRQVWHVATSRLCFVDGYVPAVCIPRAHRSYCVQLWHALGAIKKFGYQALDTPDGRSSKAAEALRMHRGYDVVIAGLPGAVSAFAEAFDCLGSAVHSLGLPRADYLLLQEFAPLRAQRAKAVPLRIFEARSQGLAVVMYAPTIRRGTIQSETWFMHAVNDLEASLGSERILLVVAGHPLQPRVESRQDDVLFLGEVATLDALQFADYVVTDYSAVAFEAGLLSKKVLFYVPDIVEYRDSPGLNLDPLEKYPGIAFRKSDSLSSAIARDVSGGECIRPFDEVAQSYIGDAKPGSIDRIVACVKAIVAEGDEMSRSDE